MLAVVEDDDNDDDDDSDHDGPQADDHVDGHVRNLFPRHAW